MLDGLLIKLGNNDWANALAAISTLLYVSSRVSFSRFLFLFSLSLSLRIRSLSCFILRSPISLPCHLLPSHSVWWGTKDVCKPMHTIVRSRVPDKVTATKSIGSSLSLSYSPFLSASLFFVRVSFFFLPLSLSITLDYLSLIFFSTSLEVSFLSPFTSLCFPLLFSAFLSRILSLSAIATTRENV